jgi:hypothetical protein
MTDKRAEILLDRLGIAYKRVFDRDWATRDLARPAVSEVARLTPSARPS